MVLALPACESRKADSIPAATAATDRPIFHLLDPAQTGVDFVNEVRETPEFNVITYRNFYNGGGVAAGDINNDGRPDIFFTSNQHQNKLYLNLGDLKFKDITVEAGVGGDKAWSTGVSMADINGDGWLDIYVCNSGDIHGDNKENELFINNGPAGIKNGVPSFTEKAKTYHLNNQGYSTHASFFDYDRDGDLDCYILNNSFKNPDRIELYSSMRLQPDLLGGDKLMRNDIETTGSFTDVTTAAGIYSSAIGFGLGIATGDLNEDGWPDLYISNDFFEKDYLYINNQHGGFTEELNDRLDYCSTSSMGGDIADLNGDGHPEIVSTDMLPGDNDRIKRMVVFEPFHLEDYRYRANYYYQFIQNCLHLNDGRGHFREIANFAGVAATDWSWGAMIFDFQNDGYNDIFISNGIYKDLMEGDFREFVYDQNNKQAGMGQKNLGISSQLPSTGLRNYAFVQHGDLQFKNEAVTLGLDQKTFSNGAVYADLDSDGDLDLVINNVNQASMVYENLTQQPGHAYLTVKLAGDKYNAFGIGAKVSLKTGGHTWVKENFTNRGFQSSIEPSLFFGLGSSSIIDTLSVYWPNGRTEVQYQVPANQAITLRTGDAKLVSSPVQSQEKLIFKELNAAEILPGAVHHENHYNDFNQEPLLLSMLSTQGPRILKGDINLDGLEDILLLGAKDDPDKLFRQQANGRFVQTNQTVLEKDKSFESTCGAFFDFEGDGDLDLLIGAGSNEVGLDKLAFIVRLYLNDGKGTYTVDANNIPPVLGNFATIRVTPYPDGTQDVFFGARVVPGNYGLRPQSYLVHLAKGSWSDHTPASISTLGMITDASWTDVYKDGWPELIVTGEWMPITVFRNQAGTLMDPVTVKGTIGWWQRIVADDLDGDGDQDFVVGNWGLNSKLQPSTLHPLTMQVGDFDANGKSEFIINWKAPDDSTLYPFCSKSEIMAQVPSLKKTGLKYEDFAGMTFADLFPNMDKTRMTTFTAENFNTGILWNDTDGLHFSPLPLEAQWAPVMAIAIQDFDQDGVKDILLAGNYFALKPQMGRQAAGRGLLLQGIGHQGFRPSTHAGLSLKTEVRDMVIINHRVFVANNNSACRILEY